MSKQFCVNFLSEVCVCCFVGDDDECVGGPDMDGLQTPLGSPGNNQLPDISVYYRILYSMFPVPYIWISILYRMFPVPYIWMSKLYRTFPV